MQSIETLWHDHNSNRAFQPGTDIFGYDKAFDVDRFHMDLFHMAEPRYHEASVRLVRRVFDDFVMSAASVDVVYVMPDCDSLDSEAIQ